MEKTIFIEGMSCGHCKAHVEETLNAIKGVEATVDLNAKKATVKFAEEVSDDTLSAAVEEAGYEVISIIKPQA
ncbi:MAG: heavy-metal-associated domain-containing protein [Anaerorhabdus sp.]